LKKTWQRITDWELWPFYLIYTPLVFVWGYYAIRARRFWFFSPVNPTLDFSGFEGETKKEMFQQLDKHTYPNTIYISPNCAFERIQQDMKTAGLSFPVAVKPDIGTKGLCFRKIENESQLRKYHEKLPVNYVLQDMIEWPMELSVFYVRYPNKKKGMVTGLIAKEYLNVVGDGQSTLLQLIEEHPRARFRVDELKAKLNGHLSKVPEKHKVHYLSNRGNHNRGAKFTNLHREIDEALVTVFDSISNSSNQFHYGRYDIKTTSMEDLKKGRNISILEFNGVGAEPNHIYDCNMGYFQALRTIATHWHHMYRIGRMNHANGVPYIGFLKGIKHLRRAKAFYQRLEEYERYC
jgi:hypothetical protein